MPNQISDRVLGEVEKNSSIAFPDKEGHSGLLLLKTMCPNPGEFGEEFYGERLKAGAADKIKVCARPALFNLVSGNLLDELLWFL